MLSIGPQREGDRLAVIVTFYWFHSTHSSKLSQVRETIAWLRRSRHPSPTRTSQGGPGYRGQELWGGWGSNPRPADYESGFALPGEYMVVYSCRSGAYVDGYRFS